MKAAKPTFFRITFPSQGWVQNNVLIICLKSCFLIQKPKFQIFGKDFAYFSIFLSILLAWSPFLASRLMLFCIANTCCLLVWGVKLKSCWRYLLDAFLLAKTNTGTSPGRNAM
jgi:hypothetical protein